MVSNTDIRLQNLLSLGLSNYSPWYLLFFFSLVIFLHLFCGIYGLVPQSFTHTYVGCWVPSHIHEIICQVGPRCSLAFLLPASAQLPLPSSQCYFLKLWPLSPHCLSPTFFLSDTERKVLKIIYFQTFHLYPPEKYLQIWLILIHFQLIPLPRLLGILPTAPQIPFSISSISLNILPNPVIFFF